MILNTAVDCGNCVALENELTSMDVSYRVALTTIGRGAEDLAMVDSAGCAAKPQQIWEEIRAGKPPVATKCEWPADLHRDVGDLIAGSLTGATPSAYFPDGSSVIGKGAILQKLKEILAAGKSL